jgi:hypothetical protein
VLHVDSAGWGRRSSSPIINFTGRTSIDRPAPNYSFWQLECSRLDSVEIRCCCCSVPSVAYAHSDCHTWPPESVVIDQVPPRAST